MRSVAATPEDAFEAAHDLPPAAPLRFTRPYAAVRAPERYRGHRDGAHGSIKPLPYFGTRRYSTSSKALAPSRLLRACTSCVLACLLPSAPANGAACAHHRPYASGPSTPTNGSGAPRWHGSFPTQSEWSQECTPSSGTAAQSVSRFEIVFETDDIDLVNKKLKENNVKLLHETNTEIWGQRTIRFYDPDGHLIEVGEAIPVFLKRRCCLQYEVVL